MSQWIQRVNWGLKYTAHLIHGRKSPFIDKTEDTAHLIHGRKSPFIDKTELRSEIHRALDSEPWKSIIDES